jgi:predicted glycoside hydrolase/deacetylase ChbG (UPF0249 family)
MWDEVERQVELFVSVMRRPPDYIDGHQHVHLLPAVREAVVGAASKIGAYVRLTREPINAAMLRRPAAIDSVYLSWASGALGRLARAAGIRANSGFRGARTFRDAAPFRDLFRSIIANATNGSIVMCHPGHVDDSLAARDSVTYTREEELAYLLGDDLHRDLAASGLRVTRLGEALS